MGLAVCLLIFAAITSVAAVCSIATERNGAKRAGALVINVGYIVVMVLSAVALING